VQVQWHACGTLTDVVMTASVSNSLSVTSDMVLHVL